MPRSVALGRDKKRTPSAPMPNLRSHAFAAKLDLLLIGPSLLSSTIMKSLPFPCILTNGIVFMLILRASGGGYSAPSEAVSYTHLRAHETPEHLVCRLLLEKKKKNTKENNINTVQDKQKKKSNKTR